MMCFSSFFAIIWQKMKKNTSWKFTDESSVTFQSSVSGAGEFGLISQNVNTKSYWKNEPFSLYSLARYFKVRYWVLRGFFTTLRCLFKYAVKGPQVSFDKSNFHKIRRRYTIYRCLPRTKRLEGGTSKNIRT